MGLEGDLVTVPRLPARLAPAIELRVQGLKIGDLGVVLLSERLPCLRVDIL